MDVPYTRDPGELVYAQRLDKLYQEVHVGRPAVFVVGYCYYAALYDRMQFLRYSKLWRESIMFEYKTRADVKGPFFLYWHN